MSRRPVVITLMVLAAIALAVVVVKVLDEVGDPEPNAGGIPLTAILPRSVDAVGVPTIGIGAGRHCDGQVLVYHDILGFEDRVRPKFVRRYADLGGDAARAIERFANDVRAGYFPASGETYHAADAVTEALGLYGSVEHAPA